MKITDIIIENADAGVTMSGNIASVTFPMTPGTKKKDARKAVDPKGYLGDGKIKESFSSVISVLNSFFLSNEVLIQ